MRYAVKKRDGHVWVIKTREEWAEETGLGVQQIIYGMRVLRARECIVTEQHFFGPRCMNWLRALDIPHPGGEPCTTLGGSPATAQTIEILPIEIQDLNTHRGITSDTPERKDSGEKVKVGEIAKSFEKKKGKTRTELQEQAEGVKSLSDYYALWRDCLVFRKGKFVPPLTKKQKGQIGLMDKALPIGAIGPFIFLVVTEWGKVCHYLKEHDGFKKPPDQPSTGLVLACVNPLIDWVASYAPTAEGEVDETMEKWGI
jgi:hypothetical protein